MPYALAQNTHSGDLNKKQYLENPLAMARAGSLEHLEAYFDKANSNGTLRNLHPFEGKEVTTSQSCLLTMYYDGGMSSERGSFYTYTPLIGVTPKGFAERMIG